MSETQCGLRLNNDLLSETTGNLWLSLGSLAGSDIDAESIKKKKKKKSPLAHLIKCLYVHHDGTEWQPLFYV